MGCDVFSYMFFVSAMFISFIYIWVRGTLPRFRYDKLMYLSWSSFMPLSLNYLLVFAGFKVLLMPFLI